MVLGHITVHMWGLDGKPSLVSPESIALFWFLNGQYTQEKNVQNIDICFTNNTDLSPEQELPVLIDESGSKVSGFVNIIESLTKDRSDDHGDKLLQSALLQFTTTQLTSLTEYQLYLNRQNYEKFTRNAFTQLLYWPMWYNTPANYRTQARECSGIIQYASHEDDPDTHEPVVQSLDPSDLAQSKAFKVTQQQKTMDKEALQEVKRNLVYLNKLSERLKTWIQIRERSFSEKIIPADLLMWANIYVQLQLPDGQKISKHLSHALGTDFFDTLQKQLLACSNSDSLIPERKPNFQEQGNVVMAVYNLVRRYIK
ncbi:hypothetical protein HG535_0C01000 [Zygotorulaspora mrakii]|uniref:Mitochondrial outer membrane transport complex Sam37/metaxin N-terminal domain-containing protein n=1 Tax=Zygotorulaspora mrakii TaxID=42260 RepID=A0A7H9AZH8_ZYGMR|nr:uncharacterized protein HG535_0C01000 [Zygotorulaspora mrakii]QLG71751.1 hypothetical protein HG535_0C01000 [Zygotorulaspora mrakii]